MGHFNDDLFEFLADLEDNNERAWFQTNKKRYEASLKNPALAFIAAFAEPLAGLSPHFRAIPKAVGGSLFRIHRDTRFSNDKTPYKTHVGIHFRHEHASDAHAPGFYLHLECGACMTGAGLWMPDNPTLLAIRTRIVEREEEWARVRAVAEQAPFRWYSGEPLKRVPRGFDKDHPFAEDLKRKSFAVMSDLSEQEAMSDELPALLAERYRATLPLMRFLCAAVDVDC